MKDSDILPQGDTMILPKEHDTTRFHLQNPNGIDNLGKEGNFWRNMTYVKEMEVDHGMMPETKLDSIKHWVKKRVYKILGTIFGQGRSRPAMGASDINISGSATECRKFGGVMSITVGNLCGRVKETGSDSMGRWVYTKFNRTGGGTVTVITTYQVNKENPALPGFTGLKAISHQFAALKLAGRHNPHKVTDHHAKDLVRFIQQCQQQDEYVCVGGDFNEIIGEGAVGMNKLCTQCNLKDAYFSRHNTQNFRTYQYGKSVIDYFLVAPELMPAVRRVGYEPFNANIPSDHRGLFIDVDTAMFFGSATIPLAPLNCRDLQSKRRKQIWPYFQELHKQFGHHNYNSKVDQLQACIDNDTEDHALAEMVDNRRIRACGTAAGKLAQYPQPPYSPELRHTSHGAQTADH